MVDEREEHGRAIILGVVDVGGDAAHERSRLEQPRPVGRVGGHLREKGVEEERVLPGSGERTRGARGQARASRADLPARRRGRALRGRPLWVCFTLFLAQIPRSRPHTSRSPTLAWGFRETPSAHFYKRATKSTKTIKKSTETVRKSTKTNENR